MMLLGGSASHSCLLVTSLSEEGRAPLKIVHTHRQRELCSLDLLTQGSKALKKNHWFPEMAWSDSPEPLLYRVHSEVTVCLTVYCKFVTFITEEPSCGSLYCHPVTENRNNCLTRSQRYPWIIWYQGTNELCRHFKFLLFPTSPSLPFTPGVI